MTSKEKLSRAEAHALEIAEDPLLAKMLEEERIESSELDVMLLFRLLRYTKPHKALTITAICLSVFESMLMTLPAYGIGLAIDRIINVSERKPQLLDAPFDAAAGVMAQLSSSDDARMQMVLGFGLVVLSVWVLRWATAIVTTYLVQKLGQFVVHDLRIDIYNHITSLGLDFFHKNPVGRLVNRTTFDVQSLSELFSDALAQGARDLMFVAALLVVMFSLDPVLAGIILGSFPLLIIVALIYRALARPSLRTMQAVQSRMNSWLAENLGGMRENQLYGKERDRSREYKSLTEAHQASVRRVIQAWGILRPGMMIVSACATAIILWVGYERVLESIITVGVLLTFLQYTTRIWVPVRNLTEKFNVIQTALTAGERVFDVLGTKSSLTNTDYADDALTVTDGSIAFEDVEFGYGKELVLKGISFDAPAGQMLALIGDTGAGKSTIVSLISRFYDVNSGSVAVDGEDVRNYKLHALRSSIALVPQDVVIFAGTIRENLTLGADFSDEEIMAAAKAVCADALIGRMSAGLDHVLDEGGRTLSAGERQLFSFARALLRDPPILILDEATASIDSKTEELIQTALERLTKGRTTVVIAHRLSTIRDADQILVLRNGEIIERGNHEALMSASGEYARLYNAHTAQAA